MIVITWQKDVLQQSEEYMSKYAGRGRTIRLCEAERAIADAQASVEFANSESRNYVRLQWPPLL
jgi:hypothetical protein